MSRNNQLDALRNRQAQKNSSQKMTRGRINNAILAGAGQPRNAAQTLMGNLDTQNTWDDLEALFNTMGQGVHSFISNILDNYKAIKAAGKNDLVCDNICRNAVRDAEETTDQLVAIHEQHKGRTGPVMGPDDNVLHISLGDNYRTTWDKYQVLALQVATEITTYTHDVITSIRSDQNLETVVEATLAQKEPEAPTQEPQQDQSAS